MREQRTRVNGEYEVISISEEAKKSNKSERMRDTHEKVNQKNEKRIVREVKGLR